MRAIGKVLLVLCCMALLFQPALVQAQQTADELQKETEAACAASATTKPTAEMIVAKVNKACELLSKEGKAAFPKFKGKDSEFIFAGTYVWIHDFHPTMLMHPIKYKLDGKSVAGMKDSNGKFLFVEMNKIAKEKGAGWVDYVWPKPGEEKASQKVSYVKMCKTPDGEELVVGIGVYDLPAAEVEKLLKN